MYMVYMSWLKQKTELGTLSVVPNTVRGRLPGPLCRERGLSHATWPAYGLKLSLRSVVGTSTARRSRAGRKWNVYDIHELAEEKTELEKLFVVPNAVWARGRSAR